MPTTDGYNGSYTGQQIDTAIAAISNKQDKLTGTSGQLVGFGTNGVAAPVDVVDGGTF